VAEKPMERWEESGGSNPARPSAERPAERTPDVLPAEKPAPVQEPAAPEPAKRPFVPAIPPEQLELPIQQTIQPPKEAPWRIAGEVLHTYIVCESEDGCVWLIDKHAAHERINFDRLKAAQTPPMRQTLLQPIAAELEREDGALLLENLPLLEEFGFGCEDFGDGALLVREVPADIDAEDTVATLEEFAENLRTGRSLAEKRENLLHTMACKAAIKGGWKSDEQELRVLVDKVQSGEVKYCPHGRPVAVKLTKYELEKMFKRA
jgi:DNA mismatch repair protein MutL